MRRRHHRVRPNPGFFALGRIVDAVALAYYTNSNSMIHDPDRRDQCVDQVPLRASRR
jgi:hypothetical protein